MVIEKFDSNKVWTVALWDAEQKFYYLKRFQLEASQKLQNFLGDNKDSRLMLMSDADYPRFEVVFGGTDAYREALVVDADEFIGVKSFKAKGKRLTTFDVEQINELEPIRFKKEVEAEDVPTVITEEDEPASDSKEMSVETDDTSPGTETNAKNDEDSVQLSLF